MVDIQTAMARSTTRNSIAFQLWWRLSAVLVAFTVIVFPVYAWIEIDGRMGAAVDEAEIKAKSVLGGLIRPPTQQPGRKEPPGGKAAPVERSLSDSIPAQLFSGFGLLAVQRIDRDGDPTEGIGPFSEPDVLGEAETEAGWPVAEVGFLIRVRGEQLERESVSPLDLLLGGSFAAGFVFPSPDPDAPGSNAASATSAGYRAVVELDNLPQESRAFFIRTLVVAGGLLAVSLAALWLLLRQFVGNPLREYGETATRIAQGEDLRIPENNANEIGRLGAAVNQMAAALRRQATEDALTGLLNSRHFDAEFPRLLMAAQDESAPLTLLNIDVDNLKPVNDNFGHLAGDQVLAAMGGCLSEWSGDRYVAWRVGGDEFAVALPGVEAAEAEGHISSLREKIAGQRVQIGSEAVSLSASIGAASYPDDAYSADDLIHAADTRMYEEKERARSSQSGELDAA